MKMTPVVVLVSFLAADRVAAAGLSKDDADAAARLQR